MQEGKIRKKWEKRFFSLEGTVLKTSKNEKSISKPMVVAKVVSYGPTTKTRKGHENAFRIDCADGAHPLAARGHAQRR